MSDDMSDSYGRLFDRVVRDPILSVIPSSVTKHHAWEGGNLTHTFEVMKVARGMVEIAAQAGEKLDGDLLSVAALLHDVGKVFAYEKRTNGWKYAAAYTRSLHIEKSIEFARREMPGCGQGRDGKKYYSALGDANSTAVRWWTDTILVRPGGKLPLTEESK